MLSDSKNKKDLSEFNISDIPNEFMMQQCLSCKRVYHVKSGEWVVPNDFLEENIAGNTTHVHCPPCGKALLRQEGFEV